MNTIFVSHETDKMEKEKSNYEQECWGLCSLLCEGVHLHSHFGGQFGNFFSNLKSIQIAHIHQVVVPLGKAPPIQTQGNSVQHCHT